MVNFPPKYSPPIRTFPPLSLPEAFIFARETCTESPVTSTFPPYPSRELAFKVPDVLLVVFANDLIVPPLFWPVVFTIAFSVISTSFSDKKTTFPPVS